MLASWMAEEKLKDQVDVQEGLENERLRRTVPSSRRTCPWRIFRRNFAAFSDARLFPGGLTLTLARSNTSGLSCCFSAHGSELVFRRSQ